ncbi:hypothetical protein LCGC14_2102750 [marine sediment metagenome]|uniref:Uncharacterized protein n=1 Tax=marine sediment metagenome TaxID=412755 RepID=A0A0F9GMI1_9ZZZZ
MMSCRKCGKKSYVNGCVLCSDCVQLCTATPEDEVVHKIISRNTLLEHEVIRLRKIVDDMTESGDGHE